jgi:hypothetical protein
LPYITTKTQARGAVVAIARGSAVLIRDCNDVPIFGDAQNDGALHILNPETELD